MLNIARERFWTIDNVSYQIENYKEKIPDVLFDTVISALSIHHLEHQDKTSLFTSIYERLPDNGLFINYDQFCAGSPEMNRWFDYYWESQLADSGLTEKDIELWKERRKLDRECSVEQEMKLLKGCSFRIVKCVYTYQKFSVIVAVKWDLSELGGNIPIDHSFGTYKKELTKYVYQFGKLSMKEHTVILNNKMDAEASS